MSDTVTLRLTHEQHDALLAIVHTQREYARWLLDGDKADYPEHDEERADWLYDIADTVATFVHTRPNLEGVR